MRQSEIKLIPSPIPDALIIIGNQGRYQKIVSYLLAAIYFLISSIILGLSYVLMAPNFKCQFSQMLVTEAVACSRLSQCYLYNDYTIVGEMSLYCDRQFYRSLIQSAFPIGALLGFIFMNFVCDTKGRRFSVLVSITCALFGIILTIVGIKVGSVVIVAIFQALSGFGAYSLAIIPYTILYDICSDIMRQKSMIFLNLMWALSQMCFGIYDTLKIKWYNFYIFIILIPLVILLGLVYKYLLQSPNFILDHQKKPNECLDVLQKIAVFNSIGEQKKKVLDDLINDYFNLKKRISTLRGHKNITQITFRRIVHKIFKNWQHTKPIIILACAYGSVYIFYFGVNYSLNMIGFDYSVNILLMGCMEFISNIALRMFASKIGYNAEYIGTIERKKGFLILYGSAGLVGLLFAFKIVQNNKIIATILVCVARLLTTAAYIFFAYLQTQSFRPKVRSTGAGIIQGLAQLGTFICPYILNFLINHDIYPVYVLSLIMLVMIIPVTQVKQTLNMRMSSYRQTEMQIVGSNVISSKKLLSNV